MSDELKRMEGSKLRNDPNYEFNLREKLMGQKRVYFLSMQKMQLMKNLQLLG